MSKWSAVVLTFSNHQSTMGTVPLGAGAGL